VSESIVTDVIARISADSANFVRGMQLAADSAQRMQQAVSGGTEQINGMTASMEGMQMRSELINKGLASLGVVAGIAGGALVHFGVKSFEAAARVNELDIAMQAVGRSTGLGYLKLRDATLAVRDNGIEMHAAQEMVLLYAKANLDVAKAQQVSRVAQDLAVISQSNSTETATRLTYAIMNQDTQMLRSVGITKSASEAFSEYAVANHMSVKSMTEMDKKAAITNMIIAEGAKVAGVYEKAMKEPAKVLRSFPRLFDDIQEAVGQGLTKAFGPLIVTAYEATKAFSHLVREGGALNYIFDAIGRVFTYIMKPATEMIAKIAEFFKKKQELFEMSKKWRESAQGVAELNAQTKHLAQKFAMLMPFITALTGFLAIKAGNTFLGDLPFIGGFLESLNPVLGALVGMILTSPEIQHALMSIVTSLKPLLNIGMEVAGVFSKVLNGALHLVAMGLERMAKWLAVGVQWLDKHRIVVYAIVAILAIYMLRTQGVSKATELWGKATEFVKKMLAGVNWQILATTAVIVVLVGAFIYAYQHSTAFAKNVDKAFNAIAKIVMTTIGYALKALGWLVTGYGQLMSATSGFGKFIRQWYTAIGKAIFTVIGFVLTMYGRFLLAMSENIKAHGVLYKAIVAVVNGILKVYSAVISAILQGVATVLRGLGKWLTGMQSFGQSFTEVVNGLIGIAKNLGHILFEIFKGVGKAIWNLGKSIVNGVTNWAKGILGAQSEVEDSTAQLGDTAQKWGVKIGDQMLGFADKLDSWAETVRNVGNTPVGEKVAEFLGKAFGIAGTQLVKWGAQATDFAGKVEGIVNTVVNTISDGALKAGAWLTSAGDTVLSHANDDFASRLKETAKNFGELAGDLFGKGAEQPKDMGKNPIVTANEKMVNDLKKLGKSAKEIAKDTAKSVLDEMKRKAQEVLDFADEIRKNISSYGSLMSLQATADTPVSAEMIYANLQQRLARITEFGKDLKTLAGMGLNNAYLQELIGAGPEAGDKMAKALIGAGKSGVEKVNTLQSAIDVGAYAIGDIGAKSQFNMGVAEAKGVQATTVQTFQNGAFQFHFGANVDHATRVEMNKWMTKAIKQAFAEAVRQGKAK